MKTNEERVRDLLGYLGSLSHVKPEEIPDIDLYMDQVTTFMESHLKDVYKRQLFGLLSLFLLRLLIFKEVIVKIIVKVVFKIFQIIWCKEAVHCLSLIHILKCLNT